MGWEPTVLAVTEIEPRPALSNVEDPIVLAPSWKKMLPVGVPLVALVTVAVYVTVPPAMTGL
jgi:hypothetical protein